MMAPFESWGAPSRRPHVRRQQRGIDISSAGAAVVRCPCIVSDDQGGSHFVVHELAMTALAPMAGLPPIATSPSAPALTVHFLHVPASESADSPPWHPAPGAAVDRLPVRHEPAGDDRRAGTYVHGWGDVLDRRWTGTGHCCVNTRPTSHAIVILDRDPTK
jgi:hypothetical protein